MPVIKLRGLPWSCTSEDVEKFLNGIKIVSMPIFDSNGQTQADIYTEGRKNMKPAIHLTTNAEGRPSGEAFIEVEEESDLEMALKRNNVLMGQRYIEVFRSNQEQLSKHLNESASNTSNWSDPVVRLRGLPYGCTKQDIGNFFIGLNIAYDGIMMVIDFSGRFNGEAFVQFVSILDAHKALDRHKQKIQNRYIEVFRSTFDEMSYYSSNSNQSRTNQQRQTNKMNKRNLMSNQSFDFSVNNSTRSSSVNDFNNRNRTKPYFRNNYSNQNNNSSNRQRNHSSSSGLPSLMENDLTVNNPNSYVCENNHRHYLNNSNDRNNYNNDNYNNNNQINFNPTKRPSTPPLLDEYPERTSHCVRMRGLPYSVSENEIRDFFRPLAPVNVILTTGRDGRPSGECECDFLSHDDACEAMKYDKKYIGNRYIELFLLSGSSKSQQKPLSFGSLMSKDFSSRNLIDLKQNNHHQNNINKSNKSDIFNDYNTKGYVSFETNTNSSPLPVPPPPLLPPNNPSSQNSSLLGPVPAATLPVQFSSNNINEILFADMAKQMTQLYNQFQTQQQQYMNGYANIPSTNIMNSGAVNNNKRY